jgi:hypothetical protein
MRILTVIAAALLVSGCVEGTTGVSGTMTRGPSSPKPKTIVVSNFVVSPDVLLIDRGYTARLERKHGAFPTHERKPRTMDRVNDEIVAAMVATLREAGLEAQPGAEEGLSASSNAVVVSGRLRASDGNAKKNEARIGDGKSNVIADMTVSTFSTLGKRELTSFSASADAKLPSGRAAASSNAAIAGVLASVEGSSEKLSPDVESASRKIGRAAGEKILAYAKTQGWLEQPAAVEVAAVAPEAKPARATAAGAKPAASAAKPAAVPVEAKPADEEAAE